MKKLKNILLLVVMLNVFQLYSYAEIGEIDSLKQVVKSNQHDSIKIKALHAWDNLIYLSDPHLDLILNLKIDSICTINLEKNLSGNDKLFYQRFLGISLNNIGIIYRSNREEEKCLKYYFKALKINKEIGDLEKISNSLNNIGDVYKEQGKSIESLNYLFKALKIKREINHKEGISYTLNNIGSVYFNLGKIEKSIKYYFKALKIQEELGNKQGIANSYLTIGNMYYLQSELEPALDYYTKALKLSEEIDNKNAIGSISGNIGNTYEKLGEYEKALEYHFKALELKKLIGNLEGVAISYDNIGNLYSDKGDLDKSFEYYSKALEMGDKIGNKVTLSMHLYNLGNLEFLRNNIKAAEEYGLRSFSLAQEIGYPNKINSAANLLSNVYEKQGKGMKALEMYKLAIVMRDSTINEENQKATIRQQTQYEFEKEQIRKENELKEQARLEAEKTSRRNNLQYSLIFLGILLLFGLVLSLGFVKVSTNVAEGLIFFAFLILFEFILVFTDPYLSDLTHDEPIYNLTANAIIALLIFPLHAVLEKLLKKRIVK
ncbi:MAG: tetratricopeptide repeat protein [Vicingaceae bacterium]|nr:tetratricopeptide repeat protein [Vicingaceae bacterium]